jgi:transitional endoplasmic reticulum ATPase
VDQITPSPFREIDWTKEDIQVERAGRRIILPGEPGEMPIDDAISTLHRVKADEEQQFNVHEVIDAHPVDAIVSFVGAMRSIYGWASAVPTPGFWGPTAPKMMSIKTGPGVDDVIQVPWGSFKLPNVENLINVTNSEHEGRPVLVIYGSVRKKERGVLLELAKLTRELLKTHSIFKGKAFTIPVDEDGDLEVMEPPTFMDVADAKADQLLLNDDVLRQVQTSLWGPIQFTNACRQHKIPLKRGVLLEGPYGCGKSLTARITAKLAQDNGWTFVNLDKVQGLQAALEFAQRYQPALVFAEDIDRIIEERDDDANDLINTIDGVLSKNAEVMVVLTTNHVERIQPVMLRPGRLDAVIRIPAPDASTVEKLVRFYGRNLIDKDSDLSGVGAELDGQIPATIREVVERSKLAMVVLGEQKVTGEALLVTAQGMTQHLDLLNKPVEDKSDAERLWDALGNLIGGKASSGKSPQQLASDVTAAVASTARTTGAKIERAVDSIGQIAMGTAAAVIERVDQAETRIKGKIISDPAPAAKKRSAM